MILKSVCRCPMMQYTQLRPTRPLRRSLPRLSTRRAGEIRSGGVACGWAAWAGGMGGGDRCDVRTWGAWATRNKNNNNNNSSSFSSSLSSSKSSSKSRSYSFSFFFFFFFFSTLKIPLQKRPQTKTKWPFRSWFSLITL
jgi:hypothetical protein